jgi:dCMP deaminase
METIVCFVPALHAGYISFFKKHPGTLCLLHSDFVSTFPKLERDIRQIDAREMKKAIDALGIFKKVDVLHVADALNFKPEGEVIMPDEDISRELKAKFFDNTPVTFERTFLRWDKQISSTDNVVPPDRVVSREELDQELLSKAQEISNKSGDWWRQIGVIAVKDGKILLSAYNRHVPTDLSQDVYGDPRSNFDAGVRIDLSTAIHAEASLVSGAAREGISLKGASIYVTTFPCPNCAKLVAEAGVKKVFYERGYSLLDAENILRCAGVEIVMVKMN